VKAVVALLAVAGVAAIAPPESSSTTIHACVNRTTGVVRVAARCRASERPVSLVASPVKVDDLHGTACVARGQTGVLKVTVIDPNPFIIYLECLRRDQYEPNDTSAAAVTVAPGFFTTIATIFPAGDQDWFQVQTSGVSPNINVQLGANDPQTTFELYRDVADPAHLVTSGAGIHGMFPTGSVPHTWYVHASSPTTDQYSMLLTS
jgi:hypothetical protein